MGVRIPPEQLFFLFGEKIVVQVSCLALFIFIGLRDFMCIHVPSENIWPLERSKGDVTGNTYWQLEKLTV